MLLETQPARKKNVLPDTIIKLILPVAVLEKKQDHRYIDRYLVQVQVLETEVRLQSWVRSGADR